MPSAVGVRGSRGARDNRIRTASSSSHAAAGAALRALHSWASAWDPFLGPLLGRRRRGVKSNGVSNARVKVWSVLDDEVVTFRSTCSASRRLDWPLQPGPLTTTSRKGSERNQRLDGGLIGGQATAGNGAETRLLRQVWFVKLTFSAMRQLLGSWQIYKGLSQTAQPPKKGSSD